jgi:hypothetical protein
LILNVLGLLLVDAVPDANAAALSVSEMLLVLLAAACAAALPVNESVKTVALVRVTTNVRPDGIPVTEYSVPLVYVVPLTKESLATVTVCVAVILPLLAAASANDVPLYVKVDGSVKLMERAWTLLLASANPDVNATALRVRLTDDVLLAAACAAALPVKDSVKTVPLVRVTTNVRPDGTPVTEYSVPLVYVVPLTNESLATVTVLVAVILPLLAVASANDVPL